MKRAKKDPVLTPATLTDGQLRDLQAWLFARKRHDALELHGLVAVHDALGRSTRRAAARAHCVAIINKHCCPSEAR